MSNPYAPPEAWEDCPETASTRDVLLRRFGAISMAYLLARILLDSFPDVPSKLAGMGLMVVFIYGFLRGGRKYHLGIAIFMAISIPGQAYFMARFLADPKGLPVPLSPHPWLPFAAGIIPHAIALLCGAVLYLRGCLKNGGDRPPGGPASGGPPPPTGMKSPSPAAPSRTFRRNVPAIRSFQTVSPGQAHR